MQRHHERIYYLVDEGLIGEAGAAPAGNNVHALADTPTTPDPSALAQEREFKFGRMFKVDAQAISTEEKDALKRNLVKLGQAMVSAEEPTDPDANNSVIPSGYTYLGQFITHEITFDVTKGLPAAETTPELVEQGRTPLLDLDSLYGDRRPGKKNLKLYEEDEVHLKYGTTVVETSSTDDRTFKNDLPRVGGTSEDKLKALIADPRNDENLPVAQTHVALIKFHNKVVDKLKAEHHPAETLFEAACEKVVRHFQWIVLHDYLPKIINESVLASVLAEGAKCFKVDSIKKLCMPVEFSVAAFRIGHSMVRDSYEWNNPRSSGPFGQIVGRAKIKDLFDFTGFSGNMRGEKALPSTWVIDWRRFFDFPDELKVKKLHPEDARKVNKAQKIDTTINLPLHKIPGFPHDIADEGMRSITARNLLRGFYLGLPTAQEVAEKMREAMQPTAIPMLTEDKIAGGTHEQLLRDCQFHKQTPLWYYILKEAEMTEQGNKLGFIGSRIIAETFYAIIMHSETSILREPQWRPDLGTRPPTFEMVDLLKFAGTISPLGTVDPVET
ncbi:MAG: peroxidase [Pyrinomonadaceae bacterium]|nr:peroxidase [Pyrinomonadaceae bacterium]